MAFEYLDLENKMYIPTQKLISQIQLDLLSLYASLRQHLIDWHTQFAGLAKEFYDNPVATSALWYDQSVSFATDLYAKLNAQLLPKAQRSYEEMLATASEVAAQTQDTISYMVDNPEQVTAEAIATMSETLTAAGNVSAELIDEIQAKTSEIVALLLEQPLQTLEATYMQVLSSLLESYFELVSNLLITL